MKAREKRRSGIPIGAKVVTETLLEQLLFDPRSNCGPRKKDRHGDDELDPMAKCRCQPKEE